MQSPVPVLNLDEHKELFAPGGYEKFLEILKQMLDTHGVISLQLEAGAEPFYLVSSAKLVQHLGREIAGSQSPLPATAELKIVDGQPAVQIDPRLLRNAAASAVVEAMTTRAA
jgi:hypothetical protein